MNLLALVLVPIIHIHADRPATMVGTNMPDPPKGAQWVVCIREGEAPDVRCYLALADGNLITLDAKVKE